MGHKTIRGARLLGQIAESRVQLTILYSVVGVLWVVVVAARRAQSRESEFWRHMVPSTRPTPLSPQLELKQISIVQQI